MYHDNDEFYEVNANESQKERRLRRLQNWIQKIQELEGEELYSDVLSLAKDINEYWLQRNSKMSNFKKKFADLDLVVWKDTVVSVEVKAPNDRLAQHQKEQLKLDAHNGIKSWVIEVHDGQIDDIKANKNRQVLFGDKLPLEVPTMDQMITDRPIPHLTKSWQNGLRLYSEYSNLKYSKQIPKGLVFKGFKLGQWSERQKVKYSRSELTTEQEDALNDLCFIWNTNDYYWSDRYASYSKYVKETGNTQVPKGFIFDDFDLSKWVSKQREAYSSNSIKSDRKLLLDDLGFVWKPASGVHNTLTGSLVTKAEKSKLAPEITLKKMPWET